MAAPAQGTAGTRTRGLCLYSGCKQLSHSRTRSGGRRSSAARSGTNRRPHAKVISPATSDTRDADAS
jgi:hypothetical protein